MFGSIATGGTSTTNATFILDYEEIIEAGGEAGKEGGIRRKKEREDWERECRERVREEVSVTE